MSNPSSFAGAAMAAAGLHGITHIVSLQIVIDGEVFTHFESFQLQQSTCSHHRFRLLLQHDLLPAVQDHTLEDARRFLGRRISVTFSYRSIPGLDTEREFIGVVTSVGFHSEHGNRGSIVLTGESPTILLDGAPHTQSFGGEQPAGLSTIADAVIKQALGESRFDVAVKPVYTGNLPYSCQYNETHYNYLCRMAAAYGEWFFYDGTTLNFGKPAAADPVRLIYGKDTDHVELRMNALHTGMQQYGYNSSSNKALSAGNTPAEGLGEAGMYAVDAGQKAFKAPSLNAAPIRAVTDQDVEAAQGAAIGAAASEAFTLTGSTTVPFLYPGCLIEMNFRRPESADVRYFSRLLITSISHSVDSLGHYRGTYEAIPSDTAFLPAPAFRMPQPQPQTAIVVSNANAQGRVKVQFDWQSGADTTDFIRVATPDGGGTNNVMQNRGFTFIPEEGDQVMVNFVHGHPDRPFVQSAMYHGGTGRGGYDSNHLKSIKTRSGNSIELDDTDGQGSITVKDASGNMVYMDGKGNITITASTDDITVNAPETMTFNARNLIINVRENISVSACMNISTVAGIDIIESAGDCMSHFAVNDLKTVATNITHIASENVEHHAKKIEKTAEEMKVESTKESMTINSADTVELRSAKKTKLF